MDSAVSGLGQVRGVITLVQEDRFRLRLEDGRSALFVLGRALGHSLSGLEALAGSGQAVTISYHGGLEAGAVADEITPGT